MIDESRVAELLKPFGLRLTPGQISRLSAYLGLLLRWNRAINLTAIRDADECVTRHFGESLYLSKFVHLNGRLLDVGSGAGFPGLVLKIVFPNLQTTLLEPVGKKRAFLKEVARVCEMKLVEVRSERLEEFLKQWIQTGHHERFDAATSRATGRLNQLIPRVAGCLKPGAGLYLWLGQNQGPEVTEASRGLIDWCGPVQIPLGERRQIWRGRREA